MSKHKTFMDMALILAEESKCISKQVACLLVKDNGIISSGVNGTPSGKENCCDYFSIEPGSKLTKEIRSKHHEWSMKHETHSEISAIGKAAKSGISIEGATCYCTLMPCWNCMISLHATGIRNVYYKNEYDLNDDLLEYMNYTHENFDVFERL